MSGTSSRSAEREDSVPGRAWTMRDVLWWCALPAAFAARQLAFVFPDAVETWFAGGVYPIVARAMGLVSGWWAGSLAELLVVVAAALGLRAALRRWRALATVATSERRLAMARAFLGASWIGAAVVSWAFLLLWGFNYARPSLQQRLDVTPEDVTAGRVLALGRVAVAGANARFAELAGGSLAVMIAPADGDPTEARTALLEPTLMPLSLAELDAAIDVAFVQLALPGDPLRAGLTPAKPLRVSPLLSRLGISGIFIPFTGEPSFNADVPDASLPVTVAHEKAHQRGITDEGEANLAAVLACLTSEHPYLRYAGWLYLAPRLVGEANRYAPDEAAVVWQELAPGPRRDLRAITEFWEQYRGTATRVAARVNDAYLRSNRVPGGIESYGRVVALVTALYEQGRLPGARGG